MKDITENLIMEHSELLCKALKAYIDDVVAQEVAERILEAITTNNLNTCVCTCGKCKGKDTDAEVHLT
jgi:hypothetical protein